MIMQGGKARNMKEYKKENKMRDNVGGLSFIIPAYNEEDGIGDTLKRLEKTLSQTGIQYEIILVNDGSEDKTLEIAGRFKNVNIINHPVNIGYGNAIKTGLRSAKYEWIGITDADGTYPVEDLPLFISEMRKGFDMVIGSRDNIGTADNITKKISRWIFKKIIKVTVKKDIVDPNSGLRLFKKNMAMSLYPFLCGSFSFTTTLTILASGMSLFIKYVPIKYSKRYGSSKVNYVKDSFRTMQYIVQGITFFNPIKFFIILSICMVIFICIPAMIFALFRMLTLSLYYMIFGATGIMLIGLGVLGDIIRISSGQKRSSVNDEILI
jgi:glycosyltransferase involved in cell wall biosynthesis